MEMGNQAQCDCDGDEEYENIGEQVVFPDDSGVGVVECDDGQHAAQDCQEAGV